MEMEPVGAQLGGSGGWGRNRPNRPVRPVHVYVLIGGVAWIVILIGPDNRDGPGTCSGGSAVAPLGD